eukprot:749190-Hanusia_phi.AAC.2
MTASAGVAYPCNKAEATPAVIHPMASLLLGFHEEGSCRAKSLRWTPPLVALERDVNSLVSNSGE